MRFGHSAAPSTINGAWDWKRQYYQSGELTNQLKICFGEGKEVWYGTVIISMRGIWCAKNDITLDRLNINKSIKEVLVVRSMEHSVKIWTHFMNSTKD